MVILGQSLAGNFTFEQVTAPVSPQAPAGTVGAKLIRIGVTGLDLFIGDPGTDTVNHSDGAGVWLKNGTALFVLRPTGLAGRIEGTVEFKIPGDAVKFTGTFAVAVNTTGARVSESLTVGGQSVSLELPAGPYLRVSGDNVQLAFAGQKLSGSFAFESATIGTVKVVRVLATNVSAAFGDGTTNFVTLSGGSGFFVIKPGGMAGDVGGTVAVTIPGVELSGTFRLALNTTGTAVIETIAFGPAPGTVTAIVLGDINGDGRADLISGTSANGLLADGQRRQRHAVRRAARRPLRHSDRHRHLARPRRRRRRRRPRPRRRHQRRREPPLPQRRRRRLRHADRPRRRHRASRSATSTATASSTSCSARSTGTSWLAGSGTGTFATRDVDLDRRRQRGRRRRPRRRRQARRRDRRQPAPSATSAPARSPRVVALATGTATALALADLDGDGKLDVIAGNQSFKNSSTAARSASPPRPPSARWRPRSPASRCATSTATACSTSSTPTARQATKLHLGTSGGGFGTGSALGVFSLNVIAGPYLRVTGDNVALTIAGQKLTGNFSFEKTTLADGTQLVTLLVPTAQLSLADGLAIVNFGGELQISAAGLAGKLNVSTPSLVLGPVTLTAAFTRLDQHRDDRGRALRRHAPAGRALPAHRGHQRRADDRHRRRAARQLRGRADDQRARHQAPRCWPSPAWP